MSGEEKKNDPVIRVTSRTRQKLKVQAAVRGKTMMEYVDWLVDQDIARRILEEGEQGTEKRSDHKP